MFSKAFWAGALGSVLLATVGCSIKVERSDGETEGGASSASGSGGAVASSGGESPAAGGAALASGGAASSNGGASVGGASSSGGAASSIGGALPGVVEECTGTPAKTRVDPAHAADIAGGATLCVRSGAVDYLSIDTPKDHAAHIFKLEVLPDADADVHIEALAQSDSSSLGTFYTTNGARTLWLALAGSSRTFLKVTPYSKGGRVVLTPTWVESPDPYEPNETKDTAALIMPNQDISTQMQRPYTTAADSTCVDWFKVDLAAGAHALSFTHLPDDVRPEVSIIGPDGGNVARMYGKNAGALFDLSFTASAGAHYVSVANYGGCPPSFFVGSTLDSLTDVYTFKITQ